MKPGNIALAQIQQADGRLKTRPVLILCQTPPFSDPLVCALSSRLHHKCEGFDEIISDSDDDYHDSGLKVPSLIRLGMIATIPASAMLGSMGNISHDRLNRLRSRLSNHIHPTTEQATNNR
jgi:mRNA interferase MazF